MPWLSLLSHVFGHDERCLAYGAKRWVFDAVLGSWRVRHELLALGPDKTNPTPSPDKIRRLKFLSSPWREWLNGVMPFFFFGSVAVALPSAPGCVALLSGDHEAVAHTIEHAEHLGGLLSEACEWTETTTPQQGSQNAVEGILSLLVPPFVFVFPQERSWTSTTFEELVVLSGRADAGLAIDDRQAIFRSSRTGWELLPVMFDRMVSTGAYDDAALLAKRVLFRGASATLQGVPLPAAPARPEPWLLEATAARGADLCPWLDAVPDGAHPLMAAGLGGCIDAVDPVSWVNVPRGVRAITELGWSFPADDAEALERALAIEGPARAELLRSLPDAQREALGAQALAAGDWLLWSDVLVDFYAGIEHRPPDALSDEVFSTRDPSVYVAGYFAGMFGTPLFEKSTQLRRIADYIRRCDATGARAEVARDPHRIPWVAWLVAVERCPEVAQALGEVHWDSGDVNLLAKLEPSPERVPMVLESWAGEGGRPPGARSLSAFRRHAVRHWSWPGRWAFYRARRSVAL